MPTHTPETLELPIKDLATLAASLQLTLQAPDFQKLRPAVEQAASAECVQCGIRLSGADLLKLGAGETADDSRLDHLRIGYCARNGCDSLFYRLTCAAHPEIDWSKLIHPARQLPSAEEESDETIEAARAVAKARRKRILLRATVAIAVLLIVFIIRQIYVGGTIPLLREPEDFKVDRGLEP